MQLSYIIGSFYYSPSYTLTVAGVCRRRLSSSVTLDRRPAGVFTRAGQAMTSCHLQSNYGSMVARRASSVTPC